MSYHGAGILIYGRHGQDLTVLLARRKHSGVWSIPGGGHHESDTDPWSTAQRETTEEFGCIPSNHQVKFSQTYPFRIIGFQWTTFVVEVPETPPTTLYPDRRARDFSIEFSDAAWFPSHSLPPKTHWLLYPVIWKLRANAW